MTLYDDFKDHLSERRSPATADCYLRDLAIVGRALRMSVPGASAAAWAKIPPPVFRIWQQSAAKTEAPKTVARRIAALRAWYAFLVSRGLAQTDPTAHLKSGSPAPVAITRAVTPEQHRAMLGAADQPENKNRLRDVALLLFLLDTGLNPTEVTDLNAAAVLHTACSVYAGNREIPLRTETLDAIERYEGHVQRTHRRVDPKALWLSDHGHRLGRHGLWAVIQRLAGAAGLGRINNRSFRVAALIEHDRNKTDIGSVQWLLGIKHKRDVVSRLREVAV
jgi:integrase/recombinase XerD